MQRATDGGVFNRVVGLDDAGDRALVRLALERLLAGLGRRRGAECPVLSD